MDSGWIGPAIQATDNLFNRIENRYQFNKANEFSAEQAQLNRDFESAEAQKARDWQSQEWQRQFDLTNQYNTPSAQMARLSAAGINPMLGSSTIDNGKSVPGATPGTSVPTGNAPSSVSPPYQQTKDIGSLIIGAQSMSANNANQRAQALQATVKTALEALKISPSAAHEILNLGMAQYKFSDEDFSRANQLLDNEVERSNLETERIRLENSLTKEFGAKKARADLDMIDQLISESIAKIGKMASDSKLNDSEIAKNNRICEELGSQIARNMAEAGLFNANATTVNNLRSWVVSSAHSKAKVDYYQKEEVKAAFNAGEKRRQWMRSPDSQDRNLWNYQMSPEGNYVTSLLNGFTKNASPLIPSTSQKNVDVNYHLP